MKITALSPAKINVFLLVLDKRGDGFHNIASLFQAISLCDVLTLSFHGVDTLSCSDPRVPTNHSNLIWKALNLFRIKTGLHFSVNIQLTKNIPLEAGLGGGSSNAATALWAINQLFNSPAAESDLQLWSSEIGSDVPFFFSHGSAYCTGRGEIVEEVFFPFPKNNLWIVKPEIGLSTRSVYKRYDGQSGVKYTPRRLLNKALNGTIEFVNDLEEPAFNLEPRLQLIKSSLLSQGSEAALMSGSGSSFFCLNETEPQNLPGSYFVSSARAIKRERGSWYDASILE